MSLLSDLAAAAETVDQQYRPNSQDVPGLLAALVAYAEHGDAFLEAAEDGAAAVAELLTPAPADEPSSASPAPAAAPAPSAPTTSVQADAGAGVPPADTPAATPAGPDEPVSPTAPDPADSSPLAAPADENPTEADLEARISDLQAQLDARRATSQATTVEHQAGDEPATQHASWNPFHHSDE